MQWLEVSAEPISGKLDELCFALESEGITGLVIEDGDDFKSFLENNKMYWDYVDEGLLTDRSSRSLVKFYLSNNEEGRTAYESIRKHCSSMVGEMSCKTMRDEDWSTNWMKYYKPIKVGKKLLIVPAWEDAPDEPDRLVLRLNPGLIFGTGSHPTTAMCLEELETYAPPSSRLLDLGCGSGILSIAALILGAGSALGLDIDPKAPETAMANASYNSITEKSFNAQSGDILSDKKLRERVGREKYDLITANIVADVIIDLAPDVSGWLAPGGIFICSGIIQGREDQVERAINRADMKIIKHISREEWHCYTAALK